MELMDPSVAALFVQVDGGALVYALGRCCVNLLEAFNKDARLDIVDLGALDAFVESFRPYHQTRVNGAVNERARYLREEFFAWSLITSSIWNAGQLVHVLNALGWTQVSETFMPLMQEALRSINANLALLDNTQVASRAITFGQRLRSGLPVLLAMNDAVYYPFTDCINI